MSQNEYFIFLWVAFLYIASPGPAVFLAISYGTSYGVKKTALVLLGNSSGLGILSFLSAIGIGAVIISSPTIAQIIKILGAFVLVYIGLKMILSFTKSNLIKLKQVTNETRTNWNLYKEGLFLALSNPKPIIFFSSIYPQFVKHNGEQIRDLALLGVTFMVLSFLTLITYGIISKNTLGKFLSKEKAKWFILFSGIVFIIIAILLVFT